MALIMSWTLMAMSQTNDPTCDYVNGGIDSYGRYTKAKPPMAKPLRGAVGCVDKDVVQKRADFENAAPQKGTVKVNIYGPMEAGNEA